MIYKWLNGLFLYQSAPSFFNTRQDMFTWLFMQTDLHHWLLNNPPGLLLADLLFYSIPVIYLIIYRYKNNAAAIAVIIMLLVNWCYVQCYTLYPINSIEGHIAWLLFPIVFLPQKEKIFALLFEGLRYFLLFFFVSAAVWKFVQGGIFNFSEMSGILLYQHNQFLTSSPGYWQTNMYFWLIQHQYVSWLLYLSATLLEACFIVGFFTKKYDRFLVLLFIIFVLMDWLIMRIPYFEISALILTLLLKTPENKQQPA